MPKVFFSYSKQDRSMLEHFRRHLSALIRQGKLDAWDDHDILPGEEWDDAIKYQLANADIILLLVSANFLATDYIWRVEIETAMKRHDQGLAKVIPIIIKPCVWDDTPFSKLNGLPSKGKPVSSYSDPDDAWMEIVQGIKRVLNSTSSAAPNVSASTIPTPSTVSYNRANLHKLLDAAFNDEALSLFCQLHFETVYNNFTAGQSKTLRLLALMDHTHRHLQTENLLQLLEKENPAQYEQFKPYFS